MRNWKKELNRELDDIVRSMPSEFAPEPETVRTERRKNVWERKRTFRFVAAGAACAVLLCVLLPVFLILAPFSQGAGGVVLMQINPEIRLYTDKNGNVSAAYSGNEDGDLLLADEKFTASLHGKPAEDAAAQIAERALAMGFIRADENAVRLTVSADNEKTAKKLQTATENSVIEYFCGKGVFIPVLSRSVPLSFFGEGSAADLANEAKKQPVTQTERRARQTEPEQVETSFRAALLDYAKEVTDYACRTAQGKKARLAKIDEKNEEIVNHEDNPGLLPLSYWSLKNSAHTITPPLATLISQTDALLNDYTVRYGQSLEGADGYALFLILNVYYSNLDTVALKETADKLLALIESFTEIFNPDPIIEFFKQDDVLYNVLTALFEGLETLPKTVENYVQNALEMLKRESKLLLFENRADFEYGGETLSYNDYQSKMQELLKKFQNFENFWNSFQ